MDAMHPYIHVHNPKLLSVVVRLMHCVKETAGGLVHERYTAYTHHVLSTCCITHYSGDTIGSMEYIKIYNLNLFSSVGT